jgi:peptidoglycan/LPS O-acetylase OafA/YrhL
MTQSRGSPTSIEGVRGSIVLGYAGRREDGSMQPTTDGARILGFDGLRAIAFTLVFFSHKVTFADAGPFGHVGVWLFFVLSGFLITRILADERSRIEQGHSTIWACTRRFYIRRAARIFPAYYLLLAVIAVISLFVQVDYFGPVAKIAYVTFTTNLLVEVRGYWAGDFGHLWSLAVEAQFYLILAPLILLLPRSRTVMLCVLMIAVGVAARVLLESFSVWEHGIGLNSFVNFSLFGLGGLASLNMLRPLPPALTRGSAQLVTLAVFIAVPALFGSYSHWIVEGKLDALIAAVLLVQIVQGQNSWFVRVLNWAALRYIGRISYGAYLVHPFIHVASLAETLGVSATLPWSIATALEYAATIAIAGASWRYMERPIIAWAARVTAREPAAVDAARSLSLRSQA